MEGIGSRENESRLGVTIFTDKTKHYTDYTTCCNNKKQALLLKIEREMTLYNKTVLEKIKAGDHIVISPHPINFVQALQAVRGAHFVTSSF